MRISDEQVKKVLSQREALVDEIQEMDLEMEPSPRPTDGPLIAKVTKEVVNMPDREDRIAEVKAMIEAGTYNPSGDAIADAMIRRAIADSVK
ncbi:MAG TPA: flagellar biosynthesis anti-sigma factor FlgM [Fimbriimonadaceae bacterium]|jgi:negative regulator of flagellin synthesis FlgM